MIPGISTDETTILRLREGIRREEEELGSSDFAGFSEGDESSVRPQNYHVLPSHHNISIYRHLKSRTRREDRNSPATKLSPCPFEDSSPYIYRTGRVRIARPPSPVRSSRCRVDRVRNLAIFVSRSFREEIRGRQGRWWREGECGG